MRVLVTGGAGYVGAHFVRALLQGGHHPVVIDDLSTGHRDAVPPNVLLYRGSVEDQRMVRGALHEHGLEAVAHFAARSQVAESVRDPRAYYQGNLRATMALLDAMLDSGVRTIAATSSAAVYGDRVREECSEDDEGYPASPYGETKLAVERMIARYARAYGLRFAALRCFNVAGAEPGLAERHDPESHLIPRLLSAAAGTEPRFVVYGNDYPTPDGTAVRDYVHVADVADGHVAALEHLLGGGDSGVFNLGSGRGSSVQQVLESCRLATGKPIPVTWGERREGDPPVLVADIRRAQDRLGWRPQRSLRSRIVHDAWAAVRTRSQPLRDGDAP